MSQALKSDIIKRHVHLLIQEVNHQYVHVNVHVLVGLLHFSTPRHVKITIIYAIAIFPS